MTSTQQFDRVISGDSHYFEPADLWWKALGHKFGERTPRVVDQYEGCRGTFFYSGSDHRPVSDIERNDPDSQAAFLEAGDKGMEACGYDPAVRVRFQEEAGVEAEVMNPTIMLAITRNPDTEVLKACSEVWNDWAAEFVSHNPKRFVGVSVIPLHDVDWAVKELDRTFKKGLVNPLINLQLQEGYPPYGDPVYDRFWAAASEANAPVTLHILNGRGMWNLLDIPDQTPEENYRNAEGWMSIFQEIQAVLANDFIFGGILQRFPKLKLVCSEFEISWIPGFMSRLDQMETLLPRLKLPKLEMRASDYMRTRVWHGFIEDTAAAHAIPYIGADRILWGSDFPHIRSIGLDAQSALREAIGNLPKADQEKLVGGNAAKVFNLN